jgi:hypothetical protein
MKNFIFVCLFLPVLANAQAWQNTGSMNSVHWLSEMVALDNQTALIVGGFDGSDRNLATCEIYNPNTGSWTVTGSLNIPRAYPMLVKLSNGHVLSMCGGTHFGSGAATGAVEEYDPTTGNWTIVGQITPKFCPTVTLLGNGKVLIAGGLVDGSASASCELYDPATNQTATTGAMSTGRFVFQSALLNDGRVLATGGEGYGFLHECEMYDPSTEKWTSVASMNQARVMGVLTSFSDNTVLAAGARNSNTTLATGSEEFDPSTMAWGATSSIKEPIHWTAGISMPDDRFMATGGIVDGPLTDPYGLIDITTSKCEWYDRTLKQWYYAPELNHTRCRHNGVYIHQTLNSLLPTDFLLIAGGQVGTSTLDSSGFHASDGGYTNTAEILDVSQPALKAYMKMSVNSAADVTDTHNNKNLFKAYYSNDGQIKVNYSIGSNDFVRLEVMSVDGHISKRMLNRQASPGSYEESISLNDFSSGAYFLHFSSLSKDYIFKFVVSK